MKKIKSDNGIQFMDFTNVPLSPQQIQQQIQQQQQQQLFLNTFTNQLTPNEYQQQQQQHLINSQQQHHLPLFRINDF